MPTPHQLQTQFPTLTSEEARTVANFIDCYEGCYSPRFIRVREGVVQLIYTKRDLDPWNFRKAVAISAQQGIIGDEWTREQLLRLTDGIDPGVLVKKRSGPRINWERDADILYGMNYWLHQWRRFKNMPNKRRRLTLDLASQKVAEELEAKGLRIQPSTVKSAYLRSRKRFLVISIPESLL